jgi:hypothetical protein
MNLSDIGEFKEEFQSILEGMKHEDGKEENKTMAYMKLLGFMKKLKGENNNTGGGEEDVEQ